MAQSVKSLPAVKKIHVQSLDQEDPLEIDSMDRGAWRATQSMGSQESDMTWQLNLPLYFGKRRRRVWKTQNKEKKNKRRYKKLETLSNTSGHRQLWATLWCFLLESWPFWVFSAFTNNKIYFWISRVHIKWQEEWTVDALFMAGGALI